MKKALTFVTLFLLLVFQTTAGQYIKILNVLPNFMLTFIVVYAISNAYTKATFFGALCGVMLDFVAPHSPFGLSALIVMYISLGVCWFSNKFYYESIIVSVVFVFVSTFVYEFLYLFLTKGIFGEASMFYAFWRYMLPEAVINAVLCLPLRMWVRWLKNEYIRGI